MIALESNEARLLSFGGGIASHILVFQHGEWDLATARLVSSFFGIEIFLSISMVFVSKMSYWNGATVALSLGGFFVLGLLSSMLVYRAFFHRLKAFPGPFLARLSNLYITSKAAKKLHLYEEVEKLHEQYGDFVRIGPMELSVSHVDSVKAILSASSPCSKGPWYNVLHPMVSLHTCRDKAEHARRRKIWDRGFSSKALREYEPRVAKYTSQLLAHLNQTQGQAVNVTEWFNFFSFDIMGDMAFGRSFRMLEEGKKHYFMSSLHKFMEGIGLFSHALWLFPIVKSTPGLNAESLRFWKWVNGQVEERKKMTPERPDVFSWILEDYQAQSPRSRQTELNLVGDAYTIVVAGSDTTAASLTTLFFELAQSPQSIKLLRSEIDEYYSADSGDAFGLSKLKYLDAVINEALRLHPAVPSGMQRLTPPEGLRIGDVFIPGNCIVQNPLHAMFRDKRNFVEPNKFIPERWTTRPELTKNGSVFVPFSTGPYSCIGKQLALMEIRYVVSQIIHKFDFTLSPNGDPDKFVNGMVDAFTLACPDLLLIFTERKAQ